MTTSTSSLKSGNNKEFNKQNIPELRFPGFKDEWKKRKLIEIGEVQDGSHETPQYYETGIPFIRLQNIERNKFIYEDIKYISQEKAEQLKRHSYQPGDIVFNKLGNPIGKTAIVPKDIEPGIMVSDVVKIRPNSKINYNFVMEFLNSPRTEKQIKIEMTGSTRKRLNLGQVKNLRIIIPCREEQDKLADFMNLLNKKIELMEKNYHTLDEYSTYTRHILFEDISKNYLFYNFEDIFKSVSTKQHQIKKSEIKNEGKIPVIDQGKKLIAGYSNDEKYILKNKGIILFGDHTTIIKFIDYDFIVGADGVKLLMPCNNKNNIKFLYYALKEYNISAEGYKRHFSILKQIELPIPSIDIQNKIEKLLSNLDMKKFLLQNEIDRTKEFKKSLLSKMFC